MAIERKDPRFSRYVKATDQVKPRIIAASFGEVGSGKTSFWLGAPGPIVVQTLDQGLEGVVEPFTKDKEIYIAEYDLGQSGGEYTHEMAMAARDKFLEDFEAAIKAGARTIIWDRESDLFPILSYADTGQVDAFGAAVPKDWERIKSHERRMIAMAKACDINLGIIQGMKNEWVSAVNKKTGAKAMGQSGKRVRGGQEDIDGLVHINLEHFRINGEFGLNVGKSRGPGGSALQDQTVMNVDFKTFAQCVFPDTEESDWL